MNNNNYIKFNEYYVKIKEEYKRTLNSFEKFSDDLILLLGEPRKTKDDYFKVIEKVIKYMGVLEYIKATNSIPVSILPLWEKYEEELEKIERDIVNHVLTLSAEKKLKLTKIEESNLIQLSKRGKDPKKERI